MPLQCTRISPGHEITRNGATRRSASKSHTIENSCKSLPAVAAPLTAMGRSSRTVPFAPARAAYSGNAKSNPNKNSKPTGAPAKQAHTQENSKCLAATSASEPNSSAQVRSLELGIRYFTRFSFGKLRTFRSVFYTAFVRRFTRLLMFSRPPDHPKVRETPASLCFVAMGPSSGRKHICLTWGNASCRRTHTQGSHVKTQTSGSLGNERATNGSITRNRPQHLPLTPRVRAGARGRAPRPARPQPLPMQTSRPLRRMLALQGPP